MIRIGPEPIDLAAMIAAVSRPAHGAICSFLGTTRETSPGDDRPVEALDYEAYVELATADFETIAAEARARWGPLEISICHRTGRVALGEASEFAINTLKAKAPIWKRETYRDGDTAWIANTPP
jgi:molybdopterin synthase catalytic subunit